MLTSHGPSSRKDSSMHMCRIRAVGLTQAFEDSGSLVKLQPMKILPHLQFHSHWGYRMSDNNRKEKLALFNNFNCSTWRTSTKTNHISHTALVHITLWPTQVEIWSVHNHHSSISACIILKTNNWTHSNSWRLWFTRKASLSAEAPTSEISFSLRLQNGK